MSTSSMKRQARGRIVEALRLELMGPSEPEELIKENPTTRYIVGRLAPARSSDDDYDALIEETENDTLLAGDQAEGDEAGEEEPAPPLIVGFNPSSMGLSFMVEASATTVDVE